MHKPGLLAKNLLRKTSNESLSPSNLKETQIYYGFNYIWINFNLK